MEFKNPLSKFSFSKKSETVKTSRSFEEKNLDLQDRLNRLYKILGWVGISFGVLGVVAVIVMLPLKTTVVKVVSVDNHTGESKVVTSVQLDKLTESEAIARHFINSYVKLRDGYNYFSLQQDYDSVLRLSAENVANSYTDLFNSSKAPKIIYNKADNVVTVKVLSNILTGSSRPDDPDKQALVRFEKKIKNVTSRDVKTEFWNVRMTYRIQPQIDSSISDRDENPLGFTVTSYQASKEARN